MNGVVHTFQAGIAGQEVLYSSTALYEIWTAVCGGW